MIKYTLTILLLTLTLNAQAKLLDKIAGVVNDKVFTLSEVERIKNTVSIRKEIAPFIYKKDTISNAEVLKLLQDSFVIKDKLAELGFVIGDDAVEGRISDTQKGLNLTRKQLLEFLESKGITMNEYFELIRDAMEYNVFQRRIIGPLITITDQELKNQYYKMNSNNKALSFKYRVIDYVLPENKVLKQDKKRLQSVFEEYRKTGNIPSIYSSFATNDLGEVSDDDLPKELSNLLRKTDEKSFSKLYVKDGQIHLFYVDKKELAESSEYLAVKNRIYGMIFQERSEKITANWLSRESLNYYILNKL